MLVRRRLPRCRIAPLWRVPRRLPLLRISRSNARPATSPPRVRTTTSPIARQTRRRAATTIRDRTKFRKAVRKRPTTPRRTIALPPTVALGKRKATLPIAATRPQGFGSNNRNNGAVNGATRTRTDRPPWAGSNNPSNGGNRANTSTEGNRSAYESRGAANQGRATQGRSYETYTGRGNEASGGRSYDAPSRSYSAPRSNYPSSRSNSEPSRSYSPPARTSAPAPSRSSGGGSAPRSNGGGSHGGGGGGGGSHGGGGALTAAPITNSQFETSSKRPGSTPGLFSFAHTQIHHASALQLLPSPRVQTLKGPAPRHFPFRHTESAG